MLQVTESIARTDVGRHRSGNEDAAFVQVPLFVLADGMGGAQSGEVASGLAVGAFIRGLPEQGSISERLQAVAHRANEEIYASSVSDPRNAGMGTTLVAAYLDGDALVIAHVGDSRAYRLRDGELTRLTEDHSLVGELVRSGRLTEDEAREHPQRSVITRALGIESLVKVDIWNYPLQSGDVILLCSDGLTDMIAEGQVRSSLLAGTSLDDAARRLIDAANAAGGRDNITVVLFRVGEVAGDAPVPPAPASWALGVDPSDFASDSGPGGDAVHGWSPAPSARPEPGAAQTLTGLHVPVRLRRAHEQRAGMAPRAEPPVRREPGPGRRLERRAPRRRRPALLRGLASALGVVVLVAVLAGGTDLVSRQYYFIGTNPQGIVVLYRGVPYVLPFGIRLYRTYYESGTPALAIPAARRATILNHSLRGRAGAVALVNDIELGEISG
jgi:protein phosphatase